MDEKTKQWFNKYVTENDMLLDLFINNPFNEFNNLTVKEYGNKYGWDSVIEVLRKIYD